MAKIQTKEIADDAVTENKFQPSDSGGHDHSHSSNKGTPVKTGEMIADLTATGTYANYAPTGIEYAETIAIVPTGPVILQGMTPNTASEFMLIIVGAQTVTVKDQDGAATGWKFFLSISNDLVINPGDWALFQKHVLLNMWSLITTGTGYQSGDSVWVHSSDAGAVSAFWHKLDIAASGILGRTAASGLKSLTPAEQRTNADVAQIGFGGMYVSSSAQTTVTQQPTYTKVAGTTTLEDADDFDMPANNRLRYTGPTTRKFLISANLTTEATGPDTFRYRIKKNGTTELAESEQRRYMSGTNDTGSVGLAAIVELAQNDYVEIFVARDGASANMTAVLMHVSATAVS